MNKEKALMWLTGMLMKRVSEEGILKIIRTLSAQLRKAVIKSDQQWDDIVVLPVLDMIDAMASDENEIIKE